MVVRCPHPTVCLPKQIYGWTQSRLTRARKMIPTTKWESEVQFASITTATQELLYIYIYIRHASSKVIMIITDPVQSHPIRINNILCYNNPSNTWQAPSGLSWWNTLWRIFGPMVDWEKSFKTLFYLHEKRRQHWHPQLLYLRLLNSWKNREEEIVLNMIKL